MRKSLLLFFIMGMILFIPRAGAQETYLLCDFEEGIPADFTLYDVDGLEPSIDMKALGFEIGIPWVVINNGENKVACSTSWYRKAGQSNDWMITPRITIDSEKAVISWRAMASDPEYSDGYSIYISETGNNVEDFGSPAVFSVSKENSSWSAREISLAGYQGKEIYLAFVNNSKDKHTLYVDDIFVGIPSRIGFTLDLGDVTPEREITVSGTAFPALDIPIKEFNAHYSYKGNTYKKEYSGLNIQPGETFRFAFDEKMVLETGEIANYKVWLSCEGDTMSVSRSVSSFARMIVAEEPTGSWCGYCIRGIVSMHRLKTNYPDQFIGIAIHNSDPMADTNYDNAIYQFYPGGFPRVIVNRKQNLKGDPGNLESMFTSAIEEPTVAAMGLKAILSEDEKRVTAESKLVFASDYDNARFALSFVVTEDKVQVSAEGYDQVNYYAGGSMGMMGGYENLPNPVPAEDMVYEDVARGIFGGFYGIEGSVPSVIIKGETLEYEYSFDLPASILNMENAHLISLLLNLSTNEIVNAQRISLKPGSVNTGTVHKDELQIGITGKDDNYLYLKITGKIKNGQLSLYSVSGQKVYETVFDGNSEASISVPTGKNKGVYILRIAVNNQIISKKVIL